MRTLNLAEFYLSKTRWQHILKDFGVFLEVSWQNPWIYLAILASSLYAGRLNFKMLLLLLLLLFDSLKVRHTAYKDLRGWLSARHTSVGG